ncbi:TcpD family membrane protein [Leuconostoc suionicum]|uniref:TcpD family membrane protein n=1 Tax=Leuconostoc suionicum TaxID=1511761 RepID=UPI001B8BDF01|nr:TcpD family membrane protein [Leuconostoc suionicum]MBS1008227.1 hypothetical protein [Leuconostoc suionicum]
MDICNALKHVLLGLLVIIAGSRIIQHYGKNDDKDMWVTILIGSLIYFFAKWPANTLAQLKIKNGITYSSNERF